MSLRLLFLLAPLALGASDLQVWNWWTNEFDVSRKVSLVLHGQTRTTRPLGDFLQARTGLIGRYYIRPKTSIVGGYFYRREPQRSPEGWGDSHRLFTGLENYKFLGAPKTRTATLLETRFLTERFFAGPQGTLTDYTRFRHRHRVSFREWKVSPLLGYEVFFFTNGLWGQRPHGGLRWRAHPKVMIDFGYYYDARAPRAGTSRHLIFTNLLLRFKRTPNPDFPDRPSF